MEFTLHRTLAEFESLAPAWNDLLAESNFNFPFLRHEYLLAWWQSRGGGEWPQNTELALVTARQAGALTGVAPLFYTNTPPNENSLLLLGSIEISDYLDLVTRPTDLPAFVAGLFNVLAEAPLAWKVLDLHNLLETSPSLAVLQAEALRHGWACTVERTYHAPSIPLPGDFDIYLAGIDKKQRHEIRRKMRRAEELGGVDWYIVDQEETLRAEVEAFLELMAADPQKAVFLSPAMRTQMHAAARQAFSANYLQLAFLTVNGRKAAGYLNFDYQNHIWVYNSGIDRAFMDYSPGWVLLGYLLQWANSQKRAEFDFMRGTEEYKYRFGGVDKFVVRAKITR